MAKTFFILGGGLLKGPDSQWHTIELGKGGDEFAASNDRWRVVAAYQLWQVDPTVKLVVLGGKGQLEKTDAPSVAEAIRLELVELGVPGKNIVTETQSGNSYQQLQQIARLAREMKLKQISILTNEWHCPRIAAMLEHAPGIKESLGAVKAQLIAAESVLEKVSGAWRDRVEAARRDPTIRKRVELEARGVSQIQSGSYKFQ